MKNRHGNEYEFVKLNDNTYTIKGDLTYWRFGGKEGQDGIHFNDLGFADPSGGPFISIGYIIDGKPITNISSTDEGILFNVSDVANDNS